MIFSLFKRRDANAELVGRLHEAVANAARAPAFYRDLHVPDTVEGRFDMMVLHAFLTLRRLKALPAPAEDLAQDLVDAVFKGFDHALRELGVGDVVVPKRMKTMAGAFFGRAKAYELALGGGEPLADAVLRNVYAQAPERRADADRLAAYVLEAVRRFEAAGFDDIAAARLPFPDPDAFCATASATPTA
jgi:cytochrome b pre-mRNA-processing protein 3